MVVKTKVEDYLNNVSYSLIELFEVLQIKRWDELIELLNANDEPAWKCFNHLLKCLEQNLTKFKVLWQQLKSLAPVVGIPYSESGSTVTITTPKKTKRIYFDVVREPLEGEGKELVKIDQTYFDVPCQPSVK